MSHIAYIFNAAGKGGGNRQAETLIHAFARHDAVDVTGVHAADTNIPENVVTEEYGYSLMFPSTIEDGIIDLDPDIVFVHGYGPDLNHRLRELSEGDDVDAEWVMRYGSNLFENWALAPTREDNDVRYITDHLWGFDWYDCLICPSEVVAERCRHFYGDDCPELAYVPNGIKRSAYAPSTFMADDELKVLTVSRAGPNDFLISPVWAVVRLAAQYPISIDVLGAGWPGPIGSIKKIAEQTEAVNYRGYVDSDTVRSYMELADVVCVPSVSQQAIPLAALEGMAAGNLVLVGTFPASQEEDALITVSVPHPPDWHEALKDALEDPDDAEEWIQQGVENVREYDVRRIVADGYIPIFEDLA
jgi:glycosyltransferase involved in cell wall biosynthesis